MQWSLVFIWIINLCNKEKIDLIQEKASQSSTLDWIKTNGEREPLIPQRALDENESTCCRTLNQKNSWWRIDLQGIYYISCISIYTKSEEPTDMSGVQIYIGNSLKNNGTSNRLVYNISDFQTDQANDLIFPSSVSGRYVTVIRQDHTRLVLCEVKIMGTKIGKFDLILNHKGRNIKSVSIYP